MFSKQYYICVPQPKNNQTKTNHKWRTKTTTRSWKVFTARESGQEREEHISSMLEQPVEMITT